MNQKNFNKTLDQFLQIDKYNPVLNIYIRKQYHRFIEDLEFQALTKNFEIIETDFFKTYNVNFLARDPTDIDKDISETIEYIKSHLDKNKHYVILIRNFAKQSVFLNLNTINIFFKMLYIKLPYISFIFINDDIKNFRRIKEFFINYPLSTNVLNLYLENKKGDITNYT